MITEMKAGHLKDIDKPSEPFEVIGKIIPRYENENWTFTELLYEAPYLKSYQDEEDEEDEEADCLEYIDNTDKGAIPPHLPESNEQNLIVIEAFLEAAKRYARGGYDVIVDGIIGPWFLKPWQSLVREHYEVHYIILRASKEETLKRAVERSKLDRKTNIELVETMWEQFSNLGIYELNVIDTTTHSIKDTVSAVKEKIVSGTALLF